MSFAQDLDDRIAQRDHLLLLHARSGHGRRADADAGGDEGGPRVEGNRVPVERDPHPVEEGRRLLARQLVVDRAEVDEEHVVLGASGHDPGPCADHRVGEDGCVADDLLRVVGEVGRSRLLEAQCLPCDLVVDRSALGEREHGFVDRRGILLLREDEPTAGTAKRLVGRGRDDVGVGDGRGMGAPRDQPDDVGGIDEEHGTHLVRDLPERRPVDDPRVRRVSSDDHLRSVLDRKCANLVHVDALGLRIDAVRDEVEQLAREADG